MQSPLSKNSDGKGGYSGRVMILKSFQENGLKGYYSYGDWISSLLVCALSMAEQHFSSTAAGGK
jgi:hypothetical protein